jgi:hypothetical protein
MSVDLQSISFFIQPQVQGAERSYLLRVEAVTQQAGQLHTSCHTVALPLTSLHPGLPTEVALAETLASVQNARRIGLHAAAAGAASYEAWLQAVLAEQTLWAQTRGVSAALADFGIEVIRQAVQGSSAENTPSSSFEPLNDWIKRGGMSE